MGYIVDGLQFVHLAQLFCILRLPPKAKEKRLGKKERRPKERWRDGWSRRAEAGSGDSAFPLEADRGEVWVWPPKVLLEHRLFKRREKQCYSCFLHRWVFPTSKCNMDWVIMLWSGIRWIQQLTPSSALFFPCGGIGSSVKEVSVIVVVIAHSLAPSTTLVLKHALCASEHGGCSPALSI